MAAKGYPGAYAKGTEIKGLDAAASDPDVQIFHAGTKRDGSRILADGGRVLGVTAKGRDIREAQAKAYAAVDKIDWPGGLLPPRHRLARGGARRGEDELASITKFRQKSRLERDIEPVPSQSFPTGTHGEFQRQTREFPLLRQK